jgi:hypothetical protein
MDDYFENGSKGNGTVSSNIVTYQTQCSSLNVLQEAPFRPKSNVGDILPDRGCQFSRPRKPRFGPDSQPGMSRISGKTGVIRSLSSRIDKTFHILFVRQMHPLVD